MKSFTKLLGCLMLLSSSLHAREMDKQQQEVWSTLVNQIASHMERDWEKHSEFIHPNAVAWGPDMAAPRDRSVAGPDLSQISANQRPNVLGYNVVPVTILVEDDVAIVNFYLVVLGEDADSPVTLRGHNTWKKDDGRWRLLATYNSWLD